MSCEVARAGCAAVRNHMIQKFVLSFQKLPHIVEFSMTGEEWKKKLSTEAKNEKINIL